MNCYTLTIAFIKIAKYIAGSISLAIMKNLMFQHLIHSLCWSWSVEKVFVWNYMLWNKTAPVLGFSMKYEKTRAFDCQKWGKCEQKAPHPPSPVLSEANPPRGRPQKVTQGPARLPKYGSNCEWNISQQKTQLDLMGENDDVIRV